MKKLAKFSKKKKIVILLSSIVVICGIAIGVMYATGVFPGQTKGSVAIDCNRICSCHRVSYMLGRNNPIITCHKCEKCSPKGQRYF